MCINDWRLGRLVRSTVLFPTMSPSIVVSPNQNRVGILIASECTFGTDPATGRLLDVINVSVGGSIIYQLSVYFPSVFFTVAEHGDLPVREIAIDGGPFSSATVSVREFTLPEKILSESIESLYAKP